MSALKSLLGFILFLVVAVLLFVYSGIYNVAADKSHWEPVRWLLETTQENSVDRRDDQVQMPSDFASATRVQKGAARYSAMCQQCHLAPGVEATPLHAGLNPAPPLLSEAAQYHSPESAFWIVKHGIKMTGMPAWGATHSDEELWDIVAFLRKLPGMTPEEYKQLSETQEDDHHRHSSH